MSERPILGRRGTIRIIALSNSDPGAQEESRPAPFGPLLSKPLSKPTIRVRQVIVTPRAPLVAPPSTDLSEIHQSQGLPFVQHEVVQVTEREQPPEHAEISAERTPSPPVPQAKAAFMQELFALSPMVLKPPAGKNSVSDSPEPLIVWEQPPQPGVRQTQQTLPRWADDVSAIPTESEFSDLGHYLGFLVDGFSAFCSAPAVLESGQWQGRIRMPPTVLPDTMLQLDVSATHAKLRFETDHAVSRQILERHAESLQAHIKTTLGDDREVEVSLW